MCQLTALARLVLLLGLVVSLGVACSQAVSVPPEPPGPGKRVGHFILYDNGTALDTKTQLMWMTHDYRNIVGKVPPDFESAQNWEVTMNRRRYGGYRDWRLPTLVEYQTLDAPQSPRRSYKGTPVRYPAAFAEGGGEWCWTQDIAEPGAGHVHQAWSFHFTNGQAEWQYAYPQEHGLGIASTGSIRLVRGPVSTAGRAR